MSLAAVALVFSVAFWSLFAEYWSRWNAEHSPFGYGYLVPPTVLYLLWCRRKKIAAEKVRPGPAWLLPAIAIAVGIHVVGLISAVTLLQSFALIALLLLAPFYLWGGAIFSHIWGPLAYLATMVPWPDQITSKFLLPSQLLSTSLAVKMLHLVGIDTYVQSTFVYTPNYNFEVAKACSGLTILFPVMAIAILNTMMVDAKMWRKILLLALAIPISIFANSFRIGLIGWIGNSGGTDLANRLHDSSGLVGVVLAILLLTAIQAWIKCLNYLPEYMPSFGKPDEEAPQ